MDFTSITAALTGIKSASDIAKLIMDSGTTLKGADIKLQMAVLIDALADAKIEIANIKEMVLEKEVQVQELQKQLETESNIKWESPYYVKISDTGEKDGPYCQNCYDSEKKLIRLQMPGAEGYWVCNKCNKGVTDSNYNSKPFTPDRSRSKLRSKAW
jgi:ribosomal protein L37AE/L43A